MSSTRSWHARELTFAAGLFALGLALRVLVVFVFSVAPTWDGQFYHRGALSIAEGQGYSGPITIAGHAAREAWSHYPVGYSALIGAAYAVFGSGIHVAPLVNSLVGALTAVLAFAFALDILGPRRARIAGALVAVHPGLVLYCALVMTEPLAGFLVLSTGYLAWKVGQRRWGLVACGIALALSALVRPQSLLSAPLLFLLFRGSLLQRLLRTMVVAAISLCAIAPWSVRNCLVLDGCALISTNGGWNLAIGALSDTGRFRPLTPEDGCRDINGPVEQDRCWAERGMQRIESEPWKWLSHIPDKLRHTYNHESFAVAYLAEADPSEWDRDHKWHVMNAMTATHHALMFVAALGAIARFSWRSWRQRAVQVALLAGLLLFAAYALSLPERPLFWIGVAVPVLGLIRLPGAPPLNPGLRYLFGLLALTSLTHMLFFGDDRYHLAISPAFCLLAAAAFRPSAPPKSATTAVAPPTLTPSS